VNRERRPVSSIQIFSPNSTIRAKSTNEPALDLMTGCLTALAFAHSRHRQLQSIRQCSRRVSRKIRLLVTIGAHSPTTDLHWKSPETLKDLSAMKESLPHFESKDAQDSHLVRQKKLYSLPSRPHNGHIGQEGSELADLGRFVARHWPSAWCDNRYVAMQISASQ
jgi:hypothetical protein